MRPTASVTDRLRIAAAPTATQATTADAERTRLPKVGKASPLRLASPPPLLPLRVAVNRLRTGRADYIGILTRSKGWSLGGSRRNRYAGRRDPAMSSRRQQTR